MDTETQLFELLKETRKEIKDLRTEVLEVQLTIVKFTTKYKVYTTQVAIVFGALGGTIITGALFLFKTLF